MPVLEAVEHAALRAGVPVDARIEKGRTLTHALRRLWEVERFDRIVAPAPTNGRGGFTREGSRVAAHERAVRDARAQAGAGGGERVPSPLLRASPRADVTVPGDVTRV